MILTRLFPAALLVLVLCQCAAAWSDEPAKPAAEADPCVTDLTEEKLDHPPERKTTFVRSKDVLPIALNVKLVDQKFAAHLDITLPKRSGDPYGAENKQVETGRVLNIFRGSEEYDEVLALQTVGGSFWLAPNFGTGQARHARETYANTLERLLAQIPPDRNPAKADRAFFASPDVDRYVRISVGSVNKRSVMIFAPTAEEAEQRAKTLLAILDQGFSRPLQLRLFKLRVTQCQQLEEHRQKRAAAEQQIKTIADELEKYADFTADALPGVRVQQFQADAELAGLKAKVEAYDKLLAKAERGSPRFQQWEDAKAAVEVELVGFEARRTTIAQVISKIKLRSELMEKQSAAINAKKYHSANVEVVSRSIRSLDEDIGAFGPVRLVDDAVTITELEWTRVPEGVPAASTRP